MRKTLSLLLVFVLAISLFTGCKKETPKEILEKSFNKSLDMKTAEMSFDMSMNVDVNGLEDPSSAFIFQMINNAKITGTMKSDVDKMESAGELTVDMSNATYKIDFFMQNGKTVFKTPFMQQYIVMDQTVSLEELDKQKADVQELNTEMMNMLLNNITDENITVLEKEKLSTPEGEAEVTGYEINFSNDEIVKVMDELFSYVFGSDIFKDAMVNSAKKAAAQQGEEVSSEEIDEMIAEAQVAMNEALETMKKNVSFDNFKLIYGIDKDYNTRNSKVEIAATIKNEENEEQFVNLGFNIETKLWNIDNPVEISMPELTEENSMKLEDLTQQFPMVN